MLSAATYWPYAGLTYIMGYTFTKAEDEDLIRRILRSPSVYREFISRHQRIVAVMTSRMISNEEDRKDISQDVFMKAYHRLSSFRFQSKLSTWVGSIAYNTCISYLEKKKHIVYVDFSLPGDDGEDQKFDPKDNGIVAPG